MKRLCDGCDVRSPWEHRCAADGCVCADPFCQEVRGEEVDWDALLA